MHCYHTAIVFVATICVASGGLIVSIYDDDLVSSNSVEETGSCEDVICNTLCQELGFTDGTCVNGQCKCERKELESKDLLSSEDSCDYRACDQLCRRLGFPGGACVGDRCQCDNFKQYKDTSPQILRLERLFRPSYEVNEIPVDAKSTTDSDVVRDEVKPEGVLEPIVRSSVSRASCDCDPRNCDRYCFRIHYTGGICVTGQCRCYK